MLTNTRTLLKDHGGLIAAGFLLVFFSAFGQSVFFGVYLPYFQEEIGLSKTALGGLYAIATVASAVVIIFTGKALDHFPLRHVLAGVMLGVAVGCFVLAGAQSAVMLLLAFFLLRQCAQGLMVLSASTAVNRYLEKDRGKAQAIVSLGGSVHIMIFPAAGLLLDHYVGWRDAWLYYGLFIIAILIPAFWIYLRHHQSTTHARWETRMKAESEKAAAAIEDEWTRAHVLKDWRFYGLVAITMISPYTGTAIVLYQRELAESLSLTPLAFAGSFPFFTGASIACSLLAGYIIDKYGEKPVLAGYPLIYAAGLAMLVVAGNSLPLTFAAMAVIGGANGMVMTIGGPLLAHMYGTKHFGGIKSLLFSSSIFASALSPFTFGFFMDAGYDIMTQLSWVIFYAGTVWLLAFPICRKLKRQGAEQ